MGGVKYSLVNKLPQGVKDSLAIDSKGLRLSFQMARFPKYKGGSFPFLDQINAECYFDSMKENGGKYDQIRSS